MMRTIIGTLLLAADRDWTLPVDRPGQASTFGLDPLFGLITASVLLAGLILAAYTIVSALRRPPVPRPRERVERQDRFRDRAA